MNRRAWSIRQRLLLLVAAIAVPMNLLVIASIVVLANGERNAHARNLQYTARTIMSAIDSQLTTYIAIGRALAASPLLREDDLGPFRRGRTGLSRPHEQLADRQRFGGPADHEPEASDRPAAAAPHDRRPRGLTARLRDPRHADLRRRAGPGDGHLVDHDRLSSDAR
jgi:hypothetical protein